MERLAARRPASSQPAPQHPTSEVVAMIAALLLASMFQQGQSQLPQSPVVRIEVTPASPVVIAQDTLRLRARALDASGREVTDARIRFIAAGARFEGQVSPDGLITSGATGTMPVSVVATVAGTAPRVERLQVAMVPGPAAGIELESAPQKLVVGQRVHLKGTAYSRHGDPRDDRLEWRSSAPNVVRVSGDGMITAVAAGSAVVRAVSGAATAEFSVTVAATPIASMTVTPGTSAVRTGDVIRF